MDRIKHKTLRNTKLIVSDTERDVDGDGFVLGLTDFEFDKCAKIAYCFDVVSDKPAVVEPKPVAETVIEKANDEPKRKPGRPAKDK